MEKENMVKNINRLTREIELMHEFLELNDIEKKFWMWRGEKQNVAI